MPANLLNAVLSTFAHYATATSSRNDDPSSAENPCICAGAMAAPATYGRRQQRGVCPKSTNQKTSNKLDTRCQRCLQTVATQQNRKYFQPRKIKQLRCAQEYRLLG